jgi:hypothetical protein
VIDPNECAALADVMAEVATGAAYGADRARFMRHLADCDDCRLELAALTRAADEVLLATPAHEPPGGFESAVLSRIAAPAPKPAPRPRRWRRLAAATAAAAIAVGAGGAVWIATSDARELADSYRSTLDAADGRYFTAAPLLEAEGTQVGHVFLYEGDPSWLFVVLDGASSDGPWQVVVVDGGEATVAVCEAEAGSCGVGATLDGSIHDIEEIRLVADDGTTVTAALDD